MASKLSHIIIFVGDMDRAVKFYRDIVGLPLKFESPEWSEFAAGETTLALHPSTEKNPPGKMEIGFTVPNLQHFHAEMQGKGVRFTIPPTKQNFGGLLAQFVDSEGTHVSVSGE
jgi:lactoylglutathione lyase